MTPAVLTEMDEIGIRSVYDLASALLLDPQGVRELTANTESHVDDVPAVEYESGRILDRDASWLTNFVLLALLLLVSNRARREAEEGVEREERDEPLGALT